MFMYDGQMNKLPVVRENFKQVVPQRVHKNTIERFGGSGKKKPLMIALYVAIALLVLLLLYWLVRSLNKKPGALAGFKHRLGNKPFGFRFY